MGVFPSVGDGEGTRGGTVENMGLKGGIIPSDGGDDGKSGSGNKGRNGGYDQRWW